MPTTTTTTRRTLVVEGDELPRWARALSGQPASGEQIEASDAADERAENGLIRIDSDGTVIPAGGRILGETVTAWVTL